VLGVAALAAAISQPREESRPSRPEPALSPFAVPTPGAPAGRVVELSERGRRRTARLEPGRSATVLVNVTEPGEVAIQDLGLVAAAEPLTPARFELLPGRAGRHRVTFRPAGTDDSITVGNILVLAE
jgi:hypothetical protein